MSADLLMFKVFIFLNCIFVVPRFQIIIIARGAAKISYSQWTALEVPLDLFSTFFSDESSWGNPRPLVPSDWLRCGQIWHNIIVGGNQAGAEKAAWKSTDISLGVRYTCTYTSNNQRPKRFCFNAVLCKGFTWQTVKTCVTTLLGVEGRKAQDQIAFCAFHSFLVEVQTNAGYIHATHVKWQPED